MLPNIWIASDHAGFAFKSLVIENLAVQNVHSLKINDLGPTNEDRVDYADFADLVVVEILKSPNSKGILICGSGQGMAMRANKTPGIRAALCWDIISATLSRAHNDANILCLGSRLIPLGLALEIVDTFLKTPFEGGRHALRVEKISRAPIKI